MRKTGLSSRLVRTGLVAIALASAPAVLASAAPARPNLILFLADDHRPDAIGALGNLHLKTPALDKLVERGMSFRRAYVMGALEGAVCLPSRCMIQTGRSLFRLPKVNLRKGYDEFAAAMSDKAEGRDWALLPRVLRAAGYETFHLGKRGNECLPALESYETNIMRDDPTPAERMNSSQACADRVIQFLRERKTERPFFLYLAPPVPHDPRVAPKQFMDVYDPAELPLPRAFLPVHPFDNGEMTVRDEQLAPWPRAPEVIRRHLADYYAAISCLDHHWGRIVGCLEDLGQFEQTIFIFAGDNGLSLGDHGLMGKQNLYEFGGMHVPLVMAGPGVRHGQSSAFVYLYDLFPTICELAGAPVPAAADGLSLVPLLTGKTGKTRDFAFTAYKNVQRAVRDDRWKLIQYPQINRGQLFDLRKDPCELNDLAARPEHAARFRQMIALLERAQKEYGDDCPLTVADPKPAAWSPPKDTPTPATKTKKAQAKTIH